MRARLGRLLRRWADRIDPAHAPTPTGWSYTHEKRGPRDTHLVWREDGRGCPVWYIGDGDLNRSFTEADSDWRTANERLADVFQQFGEAMEDAVRPLGEAFSKVPKFYRNPGGPVLPPQPTVYDPATDGPITRLKEDR